MRWGKTAHIVFLCYAFVTCLLVSAMLVTGGSAVVTVRRLGLSGAESRSTRERTDPLCLSQDLTGASTPAICILMYVCLLSRLETVRSSTDDLLAADSTNLPAAASTRMLPSCSPIGVIGELE